MQKASGCPSMFLRRLACFSLCSAPPIRSTLYGNKLTHLQLGRDLEFRQQKNSNLFARTRQLALLRLAVPRRLLEPKEFYFFTLLYCVCRRQVVSCWQVDRRELNSEFQWLFLIAASDVALLISRRRRRCHCQQQKRATQNISDWMREHVNFGLNGICYRLSYHAQTLR